MRREEALLSAFFAKEGPIAALFGVFEERAEQFAMAQKVLSAYQGKETALIEAGTGVGKSLAYLVPALIWALKHQEKTVVSTYTITLQEQLLNKDIPFLLEAFGADLKAVLVKGMGNYLCLRKLEEHPGHPLESFAKRCKEGCRSEISFPIAKEAWEGVKAESHTCSAAQCPHYRDCFFFKARKKVEDAQLLVVNHHLLITDIVLKDKQRAEEEPRSILPLYRRLVVDEAHHLEEAALDCLSGRVEAALLFRLLAPLFSEKQRLQFRELLSPDQFREVGPRLEIEMPAAKAELVFHLDEAFKAAGKLLGLQLRRRVREERFQLKEQFREAMRVFEAFNASLLHLTRTIEQKAIALELSLPLSRLEEAYATLCSFFDGEELIDRVRLIERTAQGVALLEVELDLSEQLREKLFSPLDTALLCSATLTVAESFAYVRSRLGVEEASEAIYASPFDYAANALFAIPNDLPDPSSPHFFEAAQALVLASLKASKGGAFILFTSYEMLRATKEALDDKLPYPLLSQGELPRGALLERFKEDQESVLFGTNSFWEGVDLPGSNLRNVILFKLPFKVPSDPIEEAYRDLYREKKKNAFTEKSLPEAVMKFKQGFGRLIRTKSDQGTILCLDARILTKYYGQAFLRSLPPAQRLIDSSARVVEALQQFYSSRQERAVCSSGRGGPAYFCKKAP